MKRIFLLAAALITVNAVARRPQEWPTASFIGTQDNVTVQVKSLSKEETSRMFDGAGKKLIGKRSAIFPLAITITNDQNEPVVFDKAFIDLKLMNTKQIISRCHSSLGRIAGYGLLGVGLGAILVFAPFYYAGGLIAIAAGLPWPDYIIIGVLLGSAGSTLVGAPAGGYIGVTKATIPTNKLEQQIVQISNDELIAIAPHTTAQQIVFVHNKYFSPEFDLAISGAKENINFTVTL